MSEVKTVLASIRSVKADLRLPRLALGGSMRLKVEFVREDGKDCDLVFVASDGWHRCVWILDRLVEVAGVEHASDLLGLLVRVELCGSSVIAIGHASQRFKPHAFVVRHGLPSEGGSLAGASQLSLGEGCFGNSR